MPYMVTAKSNINGIFASVPDRPRKVQYHTEVNTSLSKSNKIQESPSFEYFHKSHQYVAKIAIKNKLSKTENNNECTSIFSCAA